MSSKSSKKSASMDALLNAAIEPKTEMVNDEPTVKPVKRGKGRPKKTEGNRQQLPTYLPEPLYFDRGVAIFAKACFGHPSPSKRQKLNATTNAFGAPDVLRTCHFATTIVNSVLAS